MYNMILWFRHPCPSISSVKQANIWRDMTYWWCQYSAGLDMVQPHLTYIVPVRASRYTLITQHNNTYHHQHCSLKIKIHIPHMARLPGKVRLKWIKHSLKRISDKYAAKSNQVFWSCTYVYICLLGNIFSLLLNFPIRSQLKTLCIVPRICLVSRQIFSP